MREFFPACQSFILQYLRCGYFYINLSKSKGGGGRVWLPDIDTERLPPTAESSFIFSRVLYATLMSIDVSQAAVIFFPS